MREYGALFKNRNFLLHWLAGATSNVGNFFNSLALVKILSADPAHLGFYMSLILVAKMAPGAILGPVAGALADRFPRRTIMVISDLARAALVLGLVFVEEPMALIGLVFLAAVAAAFYNPASSAMLPTLVQPEQMVTAGSLAVMTERMAMVLGNGFGAAVLMAVGAHNVFYIDAASFVVSALLLGMMTVKAVPRATVAGATAQSFTGKFASDMREMAAFLKEAPPMRRLFTALAIAVVGDSGTNVLLVTFFTISLGLAPENLGFVWALFGGASIIGSLLIGAIGNRIHWRHLFNGGAAYIWATMCGFVMGNGVVVSTTFLTLMGLGSGAINVGLQAAVAELVPDHVRGRIFGSWATVQSLIFVAGTLAAGPLSDRFGPGAAILGFASAYLAAGIYGFFALKATPTQPQVDPA